MIYILDQRISVRLMHCALVFLFTKKQRRISEKMAASEVLSAQCINRTLII